MTPNFPLSAFRFPLALWVADVLLRTPPAGRQSRSVNLWPHDLTNHVL
jgi:hypothetical protein